jgi:hypothetical protein
MIPGYSLTGDLLAYRRCGLQYRYYNRGGLPPSRPVQQWFGQFIHGVMEESYRRWSTPGAAALPWPRDYIEEIEDEIVRRLAARGLRYRNQNLLRISKERGVLAVNVLGGDLFPLVSRAELSLSSVRPMPAAGRADFYEVNGVVDVLTSVELASASADNRILQALRACPEVADVLREGRRDPAFKFEVIVDYKGMSRPALSDRFLDDLRWQILTYTWLRSQQPDAVPVIAGVLIFVNELLPTVDETTELRRQVRDVPADTDVLPEGEDAQHLDTWRGRASGRLRLSEGFRYERALLVVPVTQALVDQALREFDQTVTQIEASVAAESSGDSLRSSWRASPNEQTCAVCDWRSFCPAADPRFRGAPIAP